MAERGCGYGREIVNRRDVIDNETGAVEAVGGASGKFVSASFDFSFATEWNNFDRRLESRVAEARSVWTVSSEAGLFV